MSPSCSYSRRRPSAKPLVGCVVCAVLWAAAAGVASPLSGVKAVGTSHLRIQYQVNSSALPLESVALWYTTDLGKSWNLYGYDRDLRSPIPFEAGSEGLFGFYLVAHNQVGESSGEPVSGTLPQQQILVDLTAPLLQAHSVSQIGMDDKRMLAVGWTAYDAHFGVRPIALEYSLEDTSEWRTITRELPNSEAYQWEVPPDVFGKITLRVTARDLAGNVSTAVFSPVVVEYAEVRPVQERQETAPAGRAPAPETKPRQPDLAEEPASRDRAKQLEALLAQARWHRERGEWSLARQRLSEILIAAPEHGDALKALAEVEYRTGDYANALRAYGDVLRLRPGDISALRGRALAEVAVNDYAAAAASLERILNIQPDDGETLLNLGDVYLMMGQRGRARELWEQARERSGADPAVKGKAAKRLNLYPGRSP